MWDRNSTDYPRSSPPKISTTDEVDVIQRMVLDDSYLLDSKMSKSISICSGSVRTVLAAIFRMSKMSVKWSQRTPTPEQELKRVDRTLLTCFQPEDGKFDRRLVTQVKTYVYHLEPE